MEMEYLDKTMNQETDLPSGDESNQGSNQKSLGVDSSTGSERRWKIHRNDSTGQLIYSDAKGEKTVQVKACFPWTAGQNFLSLIDEDSKVCVTIQSPLSLPDAELVALMKSLKQTSFLFEVVEVFEVEEEFELRNWKAKTSQGLRRFQTSMESWPRKLPDGSYLLEDVTGDVYRVSSQVPCAKKCRSVFLALLD